jgi:hypothetical protein
MRRLSVFVAIVVPLAAGAALAGSAAGSTRADLPALAVHVRSGQARACLGVRNQITWAAATVLMAGWKAAHPDARGLNGQPLWGTPKSWRDSMLRDRRALDWNAHLFAQTYGTEALAGCLAQPRHAVGATRLFANLACRYELKAPGLAPALGGELYAADRWEKGLAGCMKARSAATAKLARMQVEAARSCHAQLAATGTAPRAGGVTFAACVLKSFGG